MPRCDVIPVLGNKDAEKCSGNVTFSNGPGLVKIPTFQNDHDNKFHFSFRKLWAFTGPGLIMSVAYIHPGNIESDIQTGSMAKYKLLWVLMWSTLMGLVLQLLSVKLSTVTGLNLAELCAREYPKCPRYILWLLVEVAIIGSDIQGVLGSALAINILSNGTIPIWVATLITLADTFTFLFLENFGIQKLEVLFRILIATIGSCFFYIYITVLPDQVSILRGLATPWCHDCSDLAVLQLIGIVGAVVMPHNMYLHSALVLSRNIDRKNKNRLKEAHVYYGIESGVALTATLIINIFVVAIFASEFSGDEFIRPSIGKAAEWIGDHYGLTMKIVWAVGILVAGQSSTMTGTYAGQFVMSGFLKIHWSKWRRVLVTRFVAMLPAVLVALYSSDLLGVLHLWLNVLQMVQLPFALIPVLQFTNSKRIMGDFVNGSAMRLLSWLMALMVMSINVYIVVKHLIIDIESTLLHIIVIVMTLFYMAFIIYLMIGVRAYRRMRIWVWLRMEDVLPLDEDDDEEKDDGLKDEPGRPEKPLPSDCCGSGCQPCVKDIYKEELKMWRNDCRERIAGGQTNGAIELSVHGKSLNNDVYYKFKIIGKTAENHNCYRFKFSMPDNTEQYRSGHHVILRWKNVKSTLTRQYTLINDADVSEFFEVIIKIYDDGRMGQYIKTWNLGDFIEWRGPVGHFHYKANEQKHVLLLASGTGFAPMIQVIKEILNNERDRTVIRLLYSSRSSEDILCKYDLDKWNEFAKFSMLYVLSNRNVPDELNKMEITDMIHRRRVDKQLLSSELDRMAIPDTRVMICGSKVYNRAMADNVKQLGVDERHVFIF